MSTVEFPWGGQIKRMEELSFLWSKQMCLPTARTITGPCVNSARSSTGHCNGQQEQRVEVFTGVIPPIHWNRVVGSVPITHLQDLEKWGPPHRDSVAEAQGAPFSWPQACRHGLQPTLMPRALRDTSVFSSVWPREEFWRYLLSSLNITFSSWFGVKMQAGSQ